MRTSSCEAEGFPWGARTVGRWSPGAVNARQHRKAQSGTRVGRKDPPFKGFSRQAGSTEMGVLGRTAAVRANRALSYWNANRLD